MIDRVTFQTASGELIMPYEHLGIIMVNHTVSPPQPKIYRVALDGADGELDMTEWAGDVRFSDRTVEIVLRDLNASPMYDTLVQKLTGRRCKVSFSEDPAHYLEGRCDKIERETRQRVTDITIELTCSPWRLNRAITKKTYSIGTNTKIKLKTERMPVIPKIVLSAACTLTWDGTAHALTAGTYTPDWLVVTDAGGTLTANGSGTAEISWRDGVL